MLHDKTLETQELGLGQGLQQGTAVYTVRRDGPDRGDGDRAASVSPLSLEIRGVSATLSVAHRIVSWYPSRMR